MSMDTRMLPVTKALLERKKEQAGRDAIEAKQGGMSAADGDGYHDAAFKAAEGEFHLHTIRQAQAENLMGTGEIIPVPEQHDTVQVGHSVLVKFKNDPWIQAEHTIVHLVTTADRQALGDYFEKEHVMKARFNNGDSSMIVSVDTPLGQALLGMQKGERGSYIGQDETGGQFEYKFKLLDTEEAIASTELFNLEP